MSISRVHLYQILCGVAPLLAAPLFLPFEADEGLWGVILERFFVLWAMLLCWWMTCHYLGKASRSAESRFHWGADRLVLLLTGFLTLGSLELFRSRTSAVALAVALLALLGFGVAALISTRIASRWQALPFRASGHFVFLTAVSSLTGYCIANQWLWESLIFFIGSSGVLTAGWIARQLPSLASEAESGVGRNRRILTRTIHVGMALGPTCIMGLTANHTLPRSYLLLIALVYFLVRTYQRLQPYEDENVLHPTVAVELQAGAALFVVLLAMLNLLA